MKRHRRLLFLLHAVLLSGPLQAQWVETTGPKGGTILGLYVNGDTLFAGTLFGSVFRSTDHGSTWTAVNNGITGTPGVRSIVMIDGHVVIGTADGVYTSSNYGASWTFSSGISNNVWAVHSVGTTLFAGSLNGGVYRSTNNGLIWSAVNNGLSITQARCLASIGSVVFVGTLGGGVFRSTNNGSVWEPTTAGLLHDRVRSMTTTGNVLYAGTNGGVYMSSDSGASWTPRSTGLGNTDIYSTVFSNGTLYAGTLNSGVFSSSDGGATWAAVTDIPYDFIPVLKASGPDIYAGTGGGLFASTNGTPWTEIDIGLKSLALDMLSHNGTLYAGTYGAGIFASTDNGDTWEQRNNGLTTFIVPALVADGDTLLAGTDLEGIFRSTDLGYTWVKSDSGLLDFSVWSFEKVGTALFAGAGGRVYRSDDGGRTWTQRIAGLGYGQIIYALQGIGTTLLAAVYDAGIYKTTNNGDTWGAANVGGVNLNGVAFARAGSDILVGTAGGGVFRSTDTSASWNGINTGLTNSYVYALESKPDGGGGDNYYAGTYGGGVFWSRNNTVNWISINDGLTQLYIRSLEINTTGDTLFAGTYGRGILKRPLSEISTSVQRIDDPIPGEFVLSQNYPNPFNAGTIIGFRLHSPGFTQLKIFDLLGREMATLVNEELAQGSYQVTWNPEGFSSGMYLYQLRSGPSIHTRKLILQK